MRNLFNEIVNNVVKNIINEADFKIGDSLVIPGSESMERKIIRLKYGMNPDDFEYVDSITSLDEEEVGIQASSEGSV